MSRQQGYLHEIWLSSDTDGNYLPSCISLGPSGDAARKLMEKGSDCVWVFWANSHIETMQIYYDFMGFGKYSTTEASDYNKYPENWYKEQSVYVESLMK